MREPIQKAVKFFSRSRSFCARGIYLRGYNPCEEDPVMSIDTTNEITDLLQAWNDGEETALEKLVPLVEVELRRLARSYMRRERAGHTLQTTALINEAYVRLINARSVSWRNRAHFYGIAARVMRRILVDFSRERSYQKRGGGAFQVMFDDALAVTPTGDPDLLALDEALTELARVDERKAQVVEMRFFGGLTEKEIAVTLNVSPETARRDWRLARTWLLRRLTQKPR